MKLKDLIKHLATKPNQDAVVDYVVYERESDNIVAIGLAGKKTTELIKILAKP